MENKTNSNNNPILTPLQMYDLDNYLIKNVNIPSKLLMENAATSSANTIATLLQSNAKILILCGTGNNGGDGLALVRHLFNRYNVNYSVLGDKSQFSDDANSNFKILNNFNIKESNFEDILLTEYDCIIDAVFGIGFKPPLNNEISDLLERINNLNTLRIAIDIPTGLDSNSGIAYKNTFKADYTLTMYAIKTGLLLNDGKDYCGKILVLNLGIPNNIIYKYSNLHLYNQLKYIDRKNNTSKFDYGKCFILAGSENMSGAGCLAANAAITAGAGLVYLCSTSINYNLFSEIISYKVDKYDVNILLDESINKSITNCDSIVIGPGIGLKSDTTDLVSMILDKYKDKKIVLDADGINTVDYNKVYTNNLTITPHIGEFAKLIGKNRKDIYSELPNIVLETANKLNINILLKGPTSIISDGEETYFVSNGVPQMATAGSGDVLAGILGAIISKKVYKSNIESITDAALTHILAARNALKVKKTIIASDIIGGLQCLE